MSYEVYKMTKCPWSVAGSKTPTQFAVVDLDTNDILVFNKDSLLSPLFYRYQEDPESAWLFLNTFKCQGEIVSWLEFVVLRGIGELGIQDLFEKKRKQVNFRAETPDF